VRLHVTVGALALAAVVTSAGAAASSVEVAMPGRFYSPATLDVLVGTTVTWRNGDRSTHTVTEDDDAFDSGHVRPGQAFSETFEKTGTFRYHCTIHRFMRGTLRVFAVVLHGPDEPLRVGSRAHLDGVTPAGATDVVLQRVLPGPPEVVTRATPRADGSFSFTVRTPEPRRYRVRAGPASSPIVSVHVSPAVVVALGPRGIAIRAVPARPGAPIAVQEYDRELFSFVTVARGRLDSVSRAVIPYAAEQRTRVRVVVRGTQGWSDGVSRELSVRPR
jgi:plastocyanin